MDMITMEYIKLLMCVCIVIPFSPTECHKVSRCLDEGTRLDFSVGSLCNSISERIWIKRAFYAKSMSTHPEYCHNPWQSQSDCVLDTYDLELTLAEMCNTFGSCRAYVDWMDWDCTGTEKYEHTYVYIQYECISKLLNGYTFPFVSIDIPRNDMEIKYMANLFSFQYAQWMNKNPNHCSVKVKPYTKVTVQVLDLRGRLINLAGSCPYKLYLYDGNKEVYYEACATMSWESMEVTFESSNIEKQVDIVFDRWSGSAEGKLWLTVQANTSQSSDPVSFTISCGPDIPLLQVPSTSTSTTSTTTTTTTTSTTTTTTTPTTTTTSPTTTSTTTTTTTLPLVTKGREIINTTLADVANTTIENTTPRVNGTGTEGESDSLTIYIIIGVVCGVLGLLLLIIVIIVCVACRSKNKPIDRPYRARSGRPISYIDAYKNNNRSDPFDNMSAPRADHMEYSEIEKYNDLKPPDIVPTKSRLNTIAEEKEENKRYTTGNSGSTGRAKKQKDKKGQKNYGFDPPDEHAFKLYGTTASYC